MTPEIITLTIVSGVSIVAVAFLAAYHLGSSFMASNVATLRKELETAYGRIAILETERAHDRITIDTLIERLTAANHEIDLLKQQVSALIAKAAQSQKNAEEWQQTAHDWKAANRAQREP